MGIHLVETDPKKDNVTFDHFTGINEVREILKTHANIEGGPTLIRVTVSGNGEGTKTFEVHNLPELLLILDLNSAPDLESEA